MELESERAGVLKDQGGQAHFSPKPLPPKPDLALTQDLAALISRASLALGRLDAATDYIPNPDLFVFMYMNKEAERSSRIEGTQASLVDLLEFQIEAIDPNRPQDVFEVANYVGALKRGMERIEDGQQIDLPLINELHAILLADSRGGHKTPGVPRTIPNWIGDPHEPEDIAKAVFVPPHPDEVRRLLEEWVEFGRSHAIPDPLVRISLMHAQFETIHPYLDGNGRMGRLLISLYLGQERILRKPLLYLSDYFHRHRRGYYDHLQAVRTHGAWEDWLRFFLHGVAEVAESGARKARSIIDMREKWQQALIAEKGSRSTMALSLLDLLFERPVITIPFAAGKLDVSYQTAQRYVDLFEGLGIIREFTKYQRNRRYAFTEFLDLLEA